MCNFSLKCHKVSILRRDKMKTLLITLIVVFAQSAYASLPIVEFTATTQTVSELQKYVVVSVHMDIPSTQVVRVA